MCRKVFVGLYCEPMNSRPVKHTLVRQTSLMESKQVSLSVLPITVFMIGFILQYLHTTRSLESKYRLFPLVAWVTHLCVHFLPAHSLMKSQVVGLYSLAKMYFKFLTGVSQ